MSTDADLRGAPVTTSACQEIPGINRAEMALTMSVMRASTRDTLDRLVAIRRRQPKLGEPLTEYGSERYSRLSLIHL